MRKADGGGGHPRAPDPRAPEPLVPEPLALVIEFMNLVLESRILVLEFWFLNFGSRIWFSSRNTLNSGEGGRRGLVLSFRHHLNIILVSF